MCRAWSQHPVLLGRGACIVSGHAIFLDEVGDRFILRFPKVLTCSYDRAVLSVFEPLFLSFVIALVDEFLFPFCENVIHGPLSLCCCIGKMRYWVLLMGDGCNRGEQLLQMADGLCVAGDFPRFTNRAEHVREYPEVARE